MRGRHRLVILAVALLVIVAVATGASAFTQETSSKTATPAFQLRIGGIFPLTGDLASVGPSISAATQLAVDTINQTLTTMGLSNSISVDLVDTQDDQTATQPAIEAATKEVKVDKANVIIGTMSSTSTIAMAQAVTIRNNVVVISPTASSPQITNLKDKNTVWRVLPSDDFQGKALATAAATAFGPHATINVGARNDDFGSALQAVFVKTWKAAGGQDRAGRQLGPERDDVRHGGSEAHLGRPGRLGDHRLPGNVREGRSGARPDREVVAREDAHD